MNRVYYLIFDRNLAMNNNSIYQSNHDFIFIGHRVSEVVCFVAVGRRLQQQQLVGVALPPHSLHERLLDTASMAEDYVVQVLLLKVNEILNLFQISKSSNKILKQSIQKLLNLKAYLVHWADVAYNGV